MSFNKWIENRTFNLEDLNDDELFVQVANLVRLTLYNECAILFGQTRNGSALTIRFYEPGAEGSTIYCDDARIFGDVVRRLLDYLSPVAGDSSRSPQTGPNAR